jgi:hypothetical protein
VNSLRTTPRGQSRSTLAARQPSGRNTQRVGKGNEGRGSAPGRPCRLDCRAMSPHPPASATCRRLRRSGGGPPVYRAEAHS